MPGKTKVGRSYYISVNKLSKKFTRIIFLFFLVPEI